MLGFQENKDDPLYNRRRMAVMACVYAIVWGFVVLVVDVLYKLETSKVIAYLSFISTLSGAGLLNYAQGIKQNVQAIKKEQG